MKKKSGKFSSNKILQEQVNNLVAEKLIKNMNFIAINPKKKNSLQTKEENFDIFTSKNMPNANSNDYMKNFFNPHSRTKKSDLKKSVNSMNSIRKLSDNLNTTNNYYMNSSQGSSHLIVKELQNSILLKRDNN